MMMFSLSPMQPVARGLDGGLGEHPGGLLERGRGQPRVGGQRRLGDAHDLGTTLGRASCPPRRAPGWCRCRPSGRRARRAGSRSRRALARDAAGHLAHDELDVLVVDRHALVAVHLLDLVHEVLLGLADALDLEELLGIAGPSMIGSPAWISWPSVDLEAGEARHGVARPRCRRRPTIVMTRALALVLADADDTGRCGRGWPCPSGVRASKSSTTRGRPPAMSVPAMPPVWKVRMVSWVPGSPMDWAAMTPTASPTSMVLPVASDRP